MDANGDGFETILFQSWRRPANVALFDAVSAWYERNLKQKLTIVEHTREFELAFAPLGTPYRVNICDAGQGLQESLPLLTALHAYRLDEFSLSQVAVEEPESHLHPSLHGALGREFCSLIGRPVLPACCWRRTRKTCSSPSNLKSSEQNIEPRDVLVYWFRPLGDGSTRAERVEFDALGQPTGNWPPGVFADDIRPGSGIDHPAAKAVGTMRVFLAPALFSEARRRCRGSDRGHLPRLRWQARCLLTTTPPHHDPIKTWLDQQGQFVRDKCRLSLDESGVRAATQPSLSTIRIDVGPEDTWGSVPVLSLSTAKALLRRSFENLAGERRQRPQLPSRRRQAGGSPAAT